MAKHTLSSKDLTSKLLEADDKIEKVRSNIEEIQRDLSIKTNIIRNEEAYANKRIELLESYIFKNEFMIDSRKEKIVFGIDEPLNEEYAMFGSTIHPEFIRSPKNIFNLMSAKGPLFRGNMNTFINGVPSEDLKMSLMTDGGKGKEPFFIESEANELTLTIEVDRSVVLGDTHFNTIEIIPYLEGSFDIKSIKITEIHSKNKPSLVIEGIKGVTKRRIILNKKYEMASIEIVLRLNHINELQRYPFGLHSLQFLDADYKDSSFAICEIKRDDYIEYIGNNIKIKSDVGEIESTLNEEGVQAFVSFNNGVLSGEVQISTDDSIYPIARNAKSLFLRIPVKKSMQNISVLELETR